MKRYVCAVAFLVATIIGSSNLVSAADEKAGADQPKPAATAEKPAKKAKQVRLTKPWKDLSSLTDEQKTQIADIHRKALDEIKQIEQRERETIMAVLNDQQKAEVIEMTEKKTAERKMAAKTRTANSKAAAEQTP